MESKVTILMATYNGELFLEQQLDSILSQSYINWNLIIRDDNSKDNTVNIIKDYAEKDDRITYILSEKNLGQTINFNELLRLNTNSAYIMFADQDDVWLENKIDICLERIKLIEHNKGLQEPILVYTDLKYVDANLNEISVKKIDDTKKTLVTLLGYNYIWGCTMILNKALVEISFPISNKAQNHDYWIALHAELKGTINHIEEDTMLYRQHSNNVTGGLNNYSIISKIKRMKCIAGGYNSLIKQNIEFCKKYKSIKNKTIDSYLDIFNTSGIRLLIKAKKINIKRNSFFDTIYFYLYLAVKFKNGEKNDI